MEAKAKRQVEKVKSSAKKIIKKTVTRVSRQVSRQQSIAQKLHAKKALLNDWEELGQTWLNIEQNVQIDDCDDSNIKNLLKKYDDAISESENNLIKVMNTICESVLEIEENFDFDVHWDMQWVQNMYKIFPNFNEYAYRSHIIDRLLSDVFLNLTSVQVITGEVDNENRKEQKKNSAETEERQSGRWKHDIVYYLKFSGMKFHIGFGEIVGDAFINDDRKMKNDLEKILKEKLFSFYAMHCHDGVYLVDKIESFTLPDEAFDLKTLSHIMKRVLCFKKRIINQVDLLENYLTIDTRRKEPRKTIQNVDVSFTSS
ncbi:22402_t:CDS:2 [Gigaspora margarita]|uniref:22402_t:CDS:1 n=1 Tax=Gigaspora margarita TaxID=4874 RepID=A0ABN7VIZ4_GIGMA|nr:22402_t:CDS:2 [Gigaspora margarita]